MKTAMVGRASDMGGLGRMLQWRSEAGVVCRWTAGVTLQKRREMQREQRMAKTLSPPCPVGHGPPVSCRSQAGLGRLGSKLDAPSMRKPPCPLRATFCCRNTRNDKRCVVIAEASAKGAVTAVRALMCVVCVCSPFKEQV